MRRVAATVGYALTAAALLIALQIALALTLDVVSYRGDQAPSATEWLPAPASQVVAMVVYFATLLLGGWWLDHPRTWRLWFLPPAISTVSFVVTIALVEMDDRWDTYTDPIHAFGTLVLSTAITGSLWVALASPFVARAIPWRRLFGEWARAETAATRRSREASSSESH